jgi:cytochrome c6
MMLLENALKNRILIFLFVCLATAACAQPNSKASPGEAVFKLRCVLCHGADGRGKTTLGQQLKAANLHSNLVQRQSDAVLKGIIMHGKGNMPPFGALLEESDINQVLKYVRELGKTK